VITHTSTNEKYVSIRISVITQERTHSYECICTNVSKFIRTNAFVPVCACTLTHKL